MEAPGTMFAFISQSCLRTVQSGWGKRRRCQGADPIDDCRSDFCHGGWRLMRGAHNNAHNKTIQGSLKWSLRGRTCNAERMGCVQQMQNGLNVPAKRPGGRQEGRGMVRGRCSKEIPLSRAISKYIQSSRIGRSGKQISGRKHVQPLT